MTLTEIANQALALLGHAPISSIDGTDSTAQTLSRLQEMTLREAQQAVDWPELIVDQDVEVDATQTDDLEYRYAIPSNCLRIIGMVDGSGTYYLHDPTQSPALFAYREEAGYILTRSLAIRLRYIKYSTNPTEWSYPLLQEVYYRWAIKACLTITNDASLRNGLVAEYERVVTPQTRSIRKRSSKSHRRRDSNFSLRYLRGRRRV